MEHSETRQDAVVGATVVRATMPNVDIEDHYRSLWRAEQHSSKFTWGSAIYGCYWLACYRQHFHWGVQWRPVLDVNGGCQGCRIPVGPIVVVLPTPAIRMPFLPNCVGLHHVASACVEVEPLLPVELADDGVEDAANVRFWVKCCLEDCLPWICEEVFSVIHTPSQHL